MDEETYRAVVLEQKDRVFGYATYLLREREEAADVAQEALVRMWERRATISGPIAARAWLMRTAHNLCIDRLRSRRARRRDDAVELDQREDARVPNPSASTFGVQLREELVRALKRLSEREQQLIVLREIHELSYDELARMLDIPMGTLKALLHRARLKLRQHLMEARVHP